MDRAISRLKNQLENHNYLNIGVQSVFDMLTHKAPYDHEVMTREINRLREYVGLDEIDYVLPDKPSLSRAEIMGKIEELRFIRSRPNPYVPLHEYLVKNKNCKLELYHELYKHIFHEYDEIEYVFRNYYKKLFWNGRWYWIMNSDMRFSVIINRNIV